jgi:hypothetical protein
MLRAGTRTGRAIGASEIRNEGANNEGRSAFAWALAHLRGDPRISENLKNNRKKAARQVRTRLTGAEEFADERKPREITRNALLSLPGQPAKEPIPRSRAFRVPSSHLRSPLTRRRLLKLTGRTYDLDFRAPCHGAARIPLPRACLRTDPNRSESWCAVDACAPMTEGALSRRGPDSGPWGPAVAGTRAARGGGGRDGRVVPEEEG